MTLCHSITEVEAAADAEATAGTPLSQETADQVAAILTTAGWALPRKPQEGSSHDKRP